ncbi:MAG: DUF7670 domain-containing protein [Planctomycetota bacterium]|jgi:hypothetical protein
MGEIKRPDEPIVRWIRFYARCIALAWAVFWTLYGLVLCLRSDGISPGQWALCVTAWTVLLGSALIGWRCEGLAAIVLISESCAALGVTAGLAVMGTEHYTVTRLVLAVCGLALPPLAAGLLFHASWRRSENYRAAHMFKVATEWDIVSLVSSLIETLIS